MKKILIFSHYYVPAYKCGGPVRTLEKIADHLGDKFDFQVICSDRDYLDKKTFSGISVEKWQKVGKADVFYIGNSTRKLINIYKTIRSTDTDCYYLNSFFDPVYTLFPLFLLYLRLIPKRPVLLAPRGEFFAEAFENKALKKKLLLFVGRVMGIWRNINWHFSSSEEQRTFKCKFNNLSVLNKFNIRDLSTGLQVKEEELLIAKVVNCIDICYIARIHPHKNLLFFLEILSKVKDFYHINFDIYGLVENEIYWEKCLDNIGKFSDNVRVNYHGAVDRDNVYNIYKSHHLCVLPSKSENFCHTVRESIMCACPVLISDNTPWKGLNARGLGHELALTVPDEFLKVLENYLSMDQNEYADVRKKVFEGACIINDNDQENISTYKEMFNLILQS